MSVASPAPLTALGCIRLVILMCYTERQLFCGHGNLNTTQVYLQFREEDLRNTQIKVGFNKLLNRVMIPRIKVIKLAVFSTTVRKGVL